LVDYADLTYPSQLLVFFKSLNFYPFVLQQQLSVLDFVSYCGGSLGLFLGFSALSAIELIYFFTVKAFCIIRTRRKVKDSSSLQLKKKKVAVDVFKKSTIHGIKNIMNSNSPLVER
jgi:Amiloride-sensitive sodium channel